MMSRRVGRWGQGFAAIMALSPLAFSAQAQAEPHDAPIPAMPPGATQATDVPPAPRLEYAFTITITLTPATYLTPSSTGQDRVAIYAASGTIEGLITGKVTPMSGGDWALRRADGVIDFDARYLLELSDGTPVYIQNRGYRWGTALAMEQLKRHEPVAADQYYMRVTPRFEVPAGPHEWLSRHAFVGVGEKTPDGNRIHYYVVR